MSRIRGDSVANATNAILYKIENYELISGDIISDLELSKELNMSRTPIREAIMFLIDNEILERTQTKVIVKSVTLKDIKEILEVREAIELKSIAIIIAKGGLNSDQRNELLAIHEKLISDIEVGNFAANYIDDNLFHSKIIEFSGNKRLLSIAQRLDLQSQRLRWITLLTPTRYPNTREEHSNIIQGLFSCNMLDSEYATKNHLSKTLINYEKILNTPQWGKIVHELRNMNE